MKWELKSLDELGFIGRGKSRHRPRNASHLYGGIYPFIQTGDIKAANFRIKEFSQTYSEDGLMQSKLWKEGTLCITIAANIADTAILGIDACFPDSVIGFVPDNSKSDVRFIKYFFDIFQARMKSISTGAAQDNLSLEKLLTFKVPTPPLSTQRKIASILSAYDDLIENNLKRIKLLEEKAFLSYKGILRSEKLEKVKLNEVTQVLKRGISPKYVEDDGIVVFNQKCIRNHIVSFGDARLTGLDKKISEERLLQKYDTLVNSTGAGTLGRIAMNIQDEITSTVDSHITIVRANGKATPIFLAQSLLAQESIIENMGEGSTNQTELSPRKLGEEIKISIPMRNVMIEFENQSIPNFNLIWNLQKQNTKLREARDILLPRLMSGEIVV